MFSKTIAAIAALLILALGAFALSACGDDDTSGTSDAQETDGAFIAAMIPHHESAIEMAEIAEQRSKDPFITKLADDITSTQAQEIATMKQIFARLFDAKLKPDSGAHDGLGLTAEQAGMTHSPNTDAMLRSAKPFDRAFVDEMVPHHRGAVAMSKAVLKHTKDSELRTLAQAIISAQQREISQMNDFRTRKFGAPVPDDAGHKMDSEGEASGGAMEHEMSK